MMGNMNRPKQPYRMLKPVHPVKHKVNTNNKGEPVNPRISDSGKTVMVAGCQYNKVASAYQQIYATVQRHKVEILKGAFQRIPVPVLRITQQNLKQNKPDKNGSSNQNKGILRCK